MELYEVKVAYTNADGKKFKETVLVDAVTYGEAEEQAMKYYDKGYDDFSIKNIKPVRFEDVYPELGSYEATEESKWYRVKISLFEDPLLGKVKKQNLLVKGGNITAVEASVKKQMDGTMIDWESTSVSETDIYNVIMHV